MPTTDLAHIIQLAVAPVFLLAGIAGFLNVMAGRLGRVIDRVRVVEQRLTVPREDKERQAGERELKILRRRAAIINYAIGLCTGSGLCVCLLVGSLFLGDYFSVGLTPLITAFFIFAMLLLTIALLMFLKEIQLATRTLYMARELPER